MVRQSMPNSRKISSSSHRVRCCASLTALRTSQLLALIGKMPVDQANDSGAHTEHCRSCWIVCMSRNGRGLAYSSDSWGSRCTNCIREPVTKAECHASQVTNVVAWLHHTFSYPNFLLVTSDAGPGRTASHWGRAGSMCSATALQGGRCGDLGVYSEVKRRRPAVYMDSGDPSSAISAFSVRDTGRRKRPGGCCGVGPPLVQAIRTWFSNYRRTIPGFGSITPVHRQCGDVGPAGEGQPTRGRQRLRRTDGQFL